MLKSDGDSHKFRLLRLPSRSAVVDSTDLQEFIAICECYLYCRSGDLQTRGGRPQCPWEKEKNFWRIFGNIFEDVGDFFGGIGQWIGSTITGSEESENDDEDLNGVICLTCGAGNWGNSGNTGNNGSGGNNGNGLPGNGSFNETLIDVWATYYDCLISNSELAQAVLDKQFHFHGALHLINPILDEVLSLLCDEGGGLGWTKADFDNTFRYVVDACCPAVKTYEALGFGHGQNDILWCLYNGDGDALDEIRALLAPGVLTDPSNPSRTAREMLHNAVEAGCGNGEGLTMEMVYDNLSAIYDFVELFNIDKHARLKCVYEMLKEFGLVGEILGAYEELQGRGLKLRILYDYNQSFKIGNATRFPYNPDGSFCCGQSDYADTEATIRYTSQGELISSYSSIYWNKWFPDLSPIEMSSYFIHELLHSEFHRWVAEHVYPEPLYQVYFSTESDLWREIVIRKYGEDAPSNHHQLMRYFVDRIADDLWNINGETDITRKDHYKYFAYDLFHTDEGLVQRGFLTQEELDHLKQLNSTIISSTICD